MNMRDRHENHYHLKACILDDLSIAGFRFGSHDASDEQSQDATRFVVLVDVESSRPLAFVDEAWTYAKRTIASSWIDATVAEVVSGKHPDRTSPDQRALVITQGMASQDAALAYVAHQRALEQKIGVYLPVEKPIG